MTGARVAVRLILDCEVLVPDGATLDEVMECMEYCGAGSVPGSDIGGFIQMGWSETFRTVDSSQRKGRDICEGVVMPVRFTGGGK